jgi:hypothetical protein
MTPMITKASVLHRIRAPTARLTAKPRPGPGKEVETGRRRGRADT